jgi:hypothetical protein
MLASLCLQALASRLAGGDDAIYQLLELSEQQQQQMIGRGSVVAAAEPVNGSSSSTAVALAAPVLPLIQLEQQLQQAMVQEAKKLQRLKQEALCQWECGLNDNKSNDGTEVSTVSAGVSKSCKGYAGSAISWPDVYGCCREGMFSVWLPLVRSQCVVSKSELAN